MTTYSESPRPIVTRAPRRVWWRNASTVRLALGATFAVILLAADYAAAQSTHVIASVAGFAAAVALMGVAALQWERVVTTAQSAGLVESSA